MKHVMNVSIAASGSPSEVRERVAGQVQALGETPDQSAIVAAARMIIDKATAGVSEDDTISVQATVSIAIMDAPATVAQRRSALQEAADKKIAVLEAELQEIKAAAAAAAKAKEELDNMVVVVDPEAEG